jgi:GT2 family glycosyltransferase
MSGVVPQPQAGNRDVTAVIPNWNGAGRLERCLASLAAQAGGAPAVVVVDNGSEDGSAEEAVRAGARVIRLPRKVGFAAAVNRGIAASDSPFIAVVNNDVVLAPGWLAALLAGLEAHPACGMATGRMLMAGSEGMVDGVGDALSLGFSAARLGHGHPDGPAYAAPREVLAVSGAASLFRREVFQAVGGFEEAFFAYLEDVELCLRAQLAGFGGVYFPEAVAWHEVSASSGRQGSRHPRVVAWMTAHQLLLAARYARWGAHRVVWPRVAVSQALWGVRCLSQGHAAAWVRGLVLAARRCGKMRRWRFPPGAGAANLLRLLRWSEAQIHADRGHERFWRIYFALFPPKPSPAGTTAGGARARAGGR